MPIVIDHLTPAQCEMLDFMWGLDGPEEYEHWLGTLDQPTQQMARSLEELVRLEIMESQLKDLCQAQEVLSRIQDRAND